MNNRMLILNEMKVLLIKHAQAWSNNQFNIVEEIRNEILSKLEFERSVKHIEDQKVISGTVVSHCNEWGVPLKVLSKNDFNNLVKYKNIIRTDMSAGFGIEINGLNKAICFIDGFKSQAMIDGRNKNADSIALHELSHILLRTNPLIMNELNSPIYALWYHLMKFCCVDHMMFTDISIQNSIMKSYSMKFNSFEDYINSFIPELVELGLLFKDGTPTFNVNKKNWNPKLSWIDINKLLF